MELLKCFRLCSASGPMLTWLTTSVGLLCTSHAGEARKAYNMRKCSCKLRTLILMPRRKGVWLHSWWRWAQGACSSLLSALMEIVIHFYMMGSAGQRMIMQVGLRPILVLMWGNWYSQPWPNGNRRQLLRRGCFRKQIWMPMSFRSTVTSEHRMTKLFLID